MVDKLFKTLFSTVDSTMGKEKTSQAEDIVENNLAKTITNNFDKSECIIHSMKRKFFCEECVLELCEICQSKHEKNHTIRFMEDTSKDIT